jgi:hypothetical protein
MGVQVIMGIVLAFIVASAITGLLFIVLKSLEGKSRPYDEMGTDTPETSEEPHVVHYPGGSRIAHPEIRHSPVIEEYVREAIDDWKRK